MNKNPMIINEFCKSYLNKVVPSGASTTQVLETKQAFMSGAMIMHLTMIRMTEMSLSEEDMLEIMEMINENFSV